MEPVNGQMQRRSAAPGRERWEFPGLVKRPRLAAHLESLLLAEPGILAAEGNPVTGRLLLLYEPSRTGNEIADLVSAAWSRALAALTASSPSPSPPSPNPESRAAGPTPAAPARKSLAPEVKTTLLFSAGAIVAGRLLLGPAALSAPALLTAAAVATAVTAARWWRTWRQAQPQAKTQDRPQDRPESAGTDVAGTLRRFSRYGAKYRGRFRLAALCCVAHKVLDLASPLLVGLGLAIVATQGSPLLAALGIVSPQNQLWFLGALTVGVWALESFFERTYVNLWRNLAQDIQHDLRIDAYAHVQRLSATHLESESTGRIATVLTENINQIETFLNEGASEILQMTTNFVVVSLIYVLAAPSLAWAALLPMPLVLWGTLAFHERIGPLYARARDASGVVSGQLVTNISGIATIKSFTAEEAEIARLEGLSHDYLMANRQAIAVFSDFRPLIRLAILVGFSATIVLGGMQVLAGTLNPGTYALTLFLSQRFLWPFVHLGNAIDNFQKAVAAVGRVFDLFEAPVEPAGGPLTLSRAEVRGEIAFVDVRFAYRGEHPVLESFSLRLPPGEITGIVGATGVGKTSLVKLLLRFYDWESGEILLDGRDLREFRIHDLREVIGLVRQDEFLFSGTVRENIAYGRAGASLDEVIAAARVAEAHDFIAALPRGYEAIIGERGVRLSGGERQRICIARAILKDPPILIFDEATSSVDNETEAAIHQSLEQISAGRTILIITHRLSAVRNAAAIHVLGERGRIVEAGTHEELLGIGGFYSALWRVQTGSLREDG
ncbi:MAG TPA: ATP-binding cassette domain-containing protein [Thermoanaerobaculia bacterium]|nr:ATP-binding cassette domain-containing protein [Thermoanaerobaculia bacterium]